MDEVEAKKIVDWLCNRFKKKIVNFYHRGEDKHDILIRFSNRRWCIDRVNNFLSLEFKFVWCDPLSSGQIGEWFPAVADLHIADEPNIFYDDDYTLIANSRLQTDAEFLDFVFGLGYAIYVKDWHEDDTYFIYPGESLEEVMVKADLEEIA